MILSSAERLKQIRISGEKIKTNGRNDILDTMDKYYRNRYFRNTGVKGAGNFTLLKSFAFKTRKNII